MSDCQKSVLFLDAEIKKLYGLGPGFVITEEWIETELDKLDKQATSTNYGGRGKNRITSLSAAESRIALERLRSHFGLR